MNLAQTTVDVSGRAKLNFEKKYLVQKNHYLSRDSLILSCVLKAVL